MPLPAAWVDKIFSRLALAYGRDFLARWEGQEMAEVKADWARELQGFADMPYAIAHGLENIPADKPPTAKQFRAICNTVPARQLMGLPAPAEKPSAGVAARIATIAQAACNDPRAWASRLRDIELNRGGELPSGQIMTRAQREMWRTALRMEEVAE
jgi:hypothetical protein